MPSAVVYRTSTRSLDSIEPLFLTKSRAVGDSVPMQNEGVVAEEPGGSESEYPSPGSWTA